MAIKVLKFVVWAEQDPMQSDEGVQKLHHKEDLYSRGMGADLQN